MRNALRNPRWLGWFAFALTTVVLLSHYAWKYGLNVAPSTSGDEISYDMIAWNLSHGAGFAEGGITEEFRRLYDRDQPDQLPQQPPAAPQLVAYRPPLFPVVISGLNRLLGRQFYGVRIVNVLALATTAGLLVWYLAAEQGAIAAFSAFVAFLVLDTRTRLYGRAILTESLAVLLLTIITLILLRLRASSRTSVLAATGATVALLILDRTMFVLWVPLLLLFLLCLPAVSPVTWKDRFVHTSVFLAAVLICLTPWGLRNTLQLGRFMPMGTQGMGQLYAGYSDHAVNGRGVWTLNAERELRGELPEKQRTRLELEVALADIGRTKAIDWARSNASKIPLLAVQKVWQEYRPRSASACLILGAAVLGALSTLGQHDTRVLLLLHAMNAIVIGATWSVEGRFVVPLLFSIHVLAGIGISRTLTLLMPRSMAVEPTSEDGSLKD